MEENSYIDKGAETKEKIFVLKDTKDIDPLMERIKSTGLLKAFMTRKKMRWIY